MAAPIPSARRPAPLWPIFLVGGLLWYASAYPFHFVGSPPEGAWRHLLSLQAHNLYFGNSLANILLFVPLGFLIARRTDSWLTGPTWALIGGVVFGFGLQVMQVYIPERVPSLWDAVWNTTGALGGALIPALPRPRQGLPDGPPSRFAIALLGLWLAAATFPFVPSLDWAAIKDGLKPLLLRPRLESLAFLEAMAGWAAFAFLWRHCVRLPWDRAGPITALMAVVAAQVLVLYRAPDLSFCLGGALGLLLGLMPVAQRRQVWGLLALVVVFLIWSGLAAPATLRASPATFHWLPLAGFMQSGSLVGPWVALEKLFWYGLLLELLLTAGFRWATATLFGVALLGTIEWTQRWVAGGHVPEITDPLLFACLAMGRRQWPAPWPNPRRLAPAQGSSVARPPPIQFNRD
ncbi:VanZ family protein [Thiohalorhabdus sp.]|uniref:VanZ family protein n=1 Tax=Thiohalorhabdus sp. TaxID=3094134 RepID=UPI002FC3B7E5